MKASQRKCLWTSEQIRTRCPPGTVLQAQSPPSFMVSWAGLLRPPHPPSAGGELPEPQAPLLAGPHGLCLCPGWPGGPAAYGAALAGPGTQLCPQLQRAGSLTPRARSGVRASGFSLLPSLHPPSTKTLLGCYSSAINRAEVLIPALHLSLMCVKNKSAFEHFRSLTDPQ